MSRHSRYIPSDILVFAGGYLLRVINQRDESACIHGSPSDIIRFNYELVCVDIFTGRT